MYCVMMTMADMKPQEEWNMVLTTPAFHAIFEYYKTCYTCPKSKLKFCNA